MVEDRRATTETLDRIYCQRFVRKSGRVLETLAYNPHISDKVRDKLAQSKSRYVLQALADNPAVPPRQREKILWRLFRRNSSIIGAMPSEARMAYSGKDELRPQVWLAQHPDAPSDIYVKLLQRVKRKNRFRNMLAAVKMVSSWRKTEQIFNARQICRALAENLSCPAQVREEAGQIVAQAF